MGFIRCRTAFDWTFEVYRACRRAAGPLKIRLQYVVFLRGHSLTHCMAIRPYVLSDVRQSVSKQERYGMFTGSLDRVQFVAATRVATR